MASLLDYFDHVAVRQNRNAAQEQEIINQKAARAKQLTDQLADQDNSPAQAFANAKALRDKTANALKEQGVE